MGWELVGKPKTQRVTRGIAAQFAEMDAAPHDRPLSENRLSVYQKLFERGQFRPCTWAFARCTETGGVYRVNGKHTSILLSGIDPLPEFYVTVEEYECDTLEDVAKLYATFDSKLQSRTARDIYLNFAGTVNALSGIPSGYITAAVGGIGYALHDEDYWTKQPAERAEVLLDHPEFILWMHKLLSEGDQPRVGHGKQKNRHLLRMGPVAAMFQSWCKAKAAATEFWEAVRDETGKHPSLPDRRISRVLLTVSVHGGRSAKGAVVTRGKVVAMSCREMYVKCLHAWNAWRTGESTDLKYYENAKIPAIK